ncbi:MAG: replicative DNA helicase [Planctomycetota bacterium]
MKKTDKQPMRRQAEVPPAESSGLIEGRLMPQSLEGEAAVLGSMILDPECIGQVVQTLHAESFYRVEHQILYDVLVGLYEQGCGIDLVILRDELKRCGRLDEVGGVEYLKRIAESVPSSVNVEYYSQIVKDKFLLRGLINNVTDILNDAYDPTGSAGEKLDDAERRIFGITQQKISGSAVAIRELLTEAFENIESREHSHITGLPTGYRELDERTCGLQKGEMIIIAARPSMGKTSLALNIAEHIGADNKTGVAIFSLEMGRQQLTERILCSRAMVDSQAVRKGMCSDIQLRELTTAGSELLDKPIYIDDTAGLTPLELRGKARRLKAQYGIQCIIVDYLQLMSLGTLRVESRQQEISQISRYLKALARELEVPVVALSQLNRALESREGHRPRMSDLRESGSLEQDADVVMLLHREDYYHRGETDHPPTNTAELIIAKQRNGPTGVVELLFNEKFTRFENLSHVNEPF